MEHERPAEQEPGRVAVRVEVSVRERSRSPAEEGYMCGGERCLIFDAGRVCKRRRIVGGLMSRGAQAMSASGGQRLVVNTGRDRSAW